MTRQDLEHALIRYLPEQAVPALATLIMELHVHLRITKARSSKLGDYRAPHAGQGHRISVNHNLNQYAFMITLVHELAHLTTWNTHQHRVDPHGKEWKSEFQELMIPFLNQDIFPSDVLMALKAYMYNPAAASCSDPHLQKVLARYDEHPVIHLEDIPDGALFSLPNGMIFKKGEKRRTRYRCIEQKSGRAYLVSGVAEVELLD